LREVVETTREVTTQAILLEFCPYFEVCFSRSVVDKYQQPTGKIIKQPQSQHFQNNPILPNLKSELINPMTHSQ